MNAVNPRRAASGTVWDRYRDNFSRHLIGVSRALQTHMMQTLQEACGHRDLRLGFAPYITLIGAEGRRLSELAQTLGISRQACNQAVKPIVTAGYVASAIDPDDGRARRLTLTGRGRQLRRDGVRILREMDAAFAQLAAPDAIEDATGTLRRLYSHLALGPRVPGKQGNGEPVNGGRGNGKSVNGETVSGKPVNSKQRSSDSLHDAAERYYAGMGGLLPRLSDYTVHRLMELTQAKGHPGLKLSYGHVLTLIGPGGGRIQQMAAIQDVSKQAISAIAGELEHLGYLRREADPADARQIVLFFTPRGEALIADSVSSVDELEAEFAAIVGDAALARMKVTLGTLYHSLCLEQEVFEDDEQADIGLLATQLRQRLGGEASRDLARMLLEPASP